MFLKLNHQKLDVYQVSKKLAVACYQLTKKLPPEEKFGMISQIRRAALSVHLNLAEECSRKSLPERKRYFEIARGSVIEIDAALDIANEMEYLQSIDTALLGEYMVRCFQLLSKMITADK